VWQVTAGFSERPDRAVLDLALRRRIASEQKGAMIDGIAALAELPEKLGAAVDSSANPADSAE
jgi:hypothetical protein